MGTFTLLQVLFLLSLTNTLVYSANCIFDFEESSELGNFDLLCDGAIGKWSIKETPSGGVDRPSYVGEQMLTNTPGEMGCLRTTKSVTLSAIQKLSILLYVKKTDYSGLTLDITIKSTGKESSDAVSVTWNVVKDTDYELVKDGLWKELSHEFVLPKEDEYKVEIRLYSGSKNVEVDIDNITLEDLPGPTDECYVVPRPTTTTESVTANPSTEDPLCEAYY